jgi:DNA processing protein
MAVPGAVTSVQSAGCHELIRDHGAASVTSELDVIACIERAGGGERRAGAVLTESGSPGG